ncbi:MAG: helix-turn-helix domain-containing protein [Desulforudis sp.]|nr:MAG: helix-turn-helix domain-containing protein [Desulforudis sp.]
MLGERLKQARKAAGESQRSLAQKVGISAQAISKYERDLDTPSSGVLQGLARVLGVKVEYFFRTRRPVLVNAVFRSRHPKMPKKQQSIVLNQVQEWLERYLEVEDLWPNEMNNPDLPTYTIEKLEDVESAANQLREHWQIGFDSIDNLMELLEDKGIKIGLIQGVERFDACTLETDEGLPVIAIRAGHPGDRQRFSLAHELGHIVMDPCENVDPEKASNRFAGAFLVPAEAARRELGLCRRGIHSYELHLLKHKYGLSMQAWIHRAAELGIVADGVARSLLHLFRSEGWHKTEPGDQLPSEVPQRMERMIMRAYADGLISESRSAELLGKSLAEYWREVKNEHQLPAEMCNGH